MPCNDIGANCASTSPNDSASVSDHNEAILDSWALNHEDSVHLGESVDNNRSILAPHPVRHDAVPSFLGNYGCYGGNDSDISAGPGAYVPHTHPGPERLTESPEQLTGDNPVGDHAAELGTALASTTGFDTGSLAERLQRAHADYSRFIYGAVSQARQQVGASASGAGLWTGAGPFAPSASVSRSPSPNPAYAQQARDSNHPSASHTRHNSSDDGRNQVASGPSVADSQAVALMRLCPHLGTNGPPAELDTPPIESHSAGCESAHISPVASSSGHHSRRPSAATDISYFSHGHDSNRSHESVGGFDDDTRSRVCDAVLRRSSDHNFDESATPAEDGHPTASPGASSNRAPNTVYGPNAPEQPVRRPTAIRRGLPAGLQMTPIVAPEQLQPVRRQPSGLRHTGADKAHYADPDFSSFRRAPRRTSASSQGSPPLRPASRHNSTASQRSNNRTTGQESSEDQSRRNSSGRNSSGRSASEHHPARPDSFSQQMPPPRYESESRNRHRSASGPPAPVVFMTQHIQNVQYVQFGYYGTQYTQYVQCAPCVPTTQYPQQGENAQRLARSPSLPAHSAPRGPSTSGQTAPPRRLSASGQAASHRPSASGQAAPRRSCISGQTASRHPSTSGPTASRRPSVRDPASGSHVNDVNEATNGHPRTGYFTAERPAGPRRRPSAPKEPIKYSREHLRKMTKYPLPQKPIPSHFKLPTHGFRRFCQGDQNEMRGVVGRGC